MMLTSRRFLFAALGCGLIAIPGAGLRAQQSAAPAGQQAAPATSQDQDPLKRQMTDTQRYKAQKALREELKGTYKTWLNEEVPYIITEEERRAFMSLSNDEEREAFIENFWQRRNPNPDSAENEFREEHYRRIAYANEHFAAGKPGWKTDRGRIYIMWGAADSIDSHPSGGMYERPMEEGAVKPRHFPLRPGTIGISKASARTSISSLSTPASAATITSPLIAAKKMPFSTFPAQVSLNMRK